MAEFRTSLTLMGLALAFFITSHAAVAGTDVNEVNKGDLGISLVNFSTNAEGKSDCACVHGLYGSGIKPDDNTGGNTQPIIISPAAAPAEGQIPEKPPVIAKRFACVVKDTAYWVYTQHVCDVLRASTQTPSTKIKGKKLRKVALRGTGPAVRRTVTRSKACVFGAPNASGCRQN